MEKRAKSKNWEDKEIEVLLLEVGTAYGFLCSHFQNKVTIKKKRDIWKKIADTVNSVGLNNRPVDACRKKWKDLKSGYLNRPKHNAGTGGGKTAPPGPFDEIIGQIIGTTNLTEGIKGGFDSSMVVCHIPVDDTSSCFERVSGLKPESLGDYAIDASNHSSSCIDAAKASTSKSFIIEMAVDNDDTPQIVEDCEPEVSIILVEEPQPRKKKVKKQHFRTQAASTPVELDNELYNKWMQSAITKNEKQAELAELMKKKLLLEINLLTKQSAELYI